MQVSRFSYISTNRALRTSRVFFSESRALFIHRPHLPEPPQPLAGPFGSVQSITQTDINQYVAPLYEHNWCIYHEIPNLAVLDDALERDPRYVPVLGKKFWFRRSLGAVKFLGDVVRIAREEGAFKPRQLELRISMLLGKRKQFIIVRTHTARTLGRTEDISEANVKPGLSARDLRLAILLENHFHDEYVASAHASPLPDLPLRPIVPNIDQLRTWRARGARRAEEEMMLDGMWTPLPTELFTLPPSPAPEEAATTCTDTHFDMFLRPLYMRGWHAAFLPIMGDNKLYAPTLSLTGFFRFKHPSTAASFIWDVSHLWYKEDNAELHFLVDALTVRAQLVYPPPQNALTLGNLRAALRIERIFHDKYFALARMSEVHPYRSPNHQPKTVEELRRTRDRAFKAFHLRNNKKMMWKRIES
ncbi:hypothetical protein DFH07DRAFT_573492 [Mycena maculata]|uniref:Uncharacterized protein n=1 Tax=Mycena maculata TaxID=230809 RepID=A0AAD7IRQ0_9AGAR|nr:hypothetical protein DFH07DRAFT_573492 [Mycena maculata]